VNSIIESASSYAADIDNLIIVITLICGFWFLVAEVIFFYLIFKFKKKDGVKAQYITGESHNENKWIHWPHYAIIAFDIVIIILSVKVWSAVKIDLPEPDTTIEVIGRQWAWKFVHPGPDNTLGTYDDIFTVDELHLEVNKTYHFKLKSEDVLHSFSVPVFRLKQDAVPGRVITGWVKPTKESPEEGFDIQCAEMCGIGHGVMGAKLYIKSAEEHQKWLQDNTTAKLD
jgi:cytochrome c oxidase subunit II